MIRIVILYVVNTVSLRKVCVTAARRREHVIILSEGNTVTTEQQKF